MRLRASAQAAAGVLPVRRPEQCRGPLLPWPPPGSQTSLPRLGWGPGRLQGSVARGRGQQKAVGRSGGRGGDSRGSSRQAGGRPRRAAGTLPSPQHWPRTPLTAIVWLVCSVAELLEQRQRVPRSSHQGGMVGCAAPAQEAAQIAHPILLAALQVAPTAGLRRRWVGVWGDDRGSWEQAVAAK